MVMRSVWGPEYTSEAQLLRYCDLDTLGLVRLYVLFAGRGVTVAVLDR